MKNTIFKRILFFLFAVALLSGIYFVYHSTLKKKSIAGKINAQKKSGNDTSGAGVTTKISDVTIYETVAGAKPADKIPLTDSFINMDDYYKSGDFVSYYGKPVDPPPFNFNVDLTGKSLPQLRVLENEIYARHHYLFQDAVMRGYFNQFAWYQPIFWISGYKLQLDSTEKRFVLRVNDRENELLKQNYLEKKGAQMANMNNVVNLSQFKNIPDSLYSHLNNDGVAIVPGKNEQLFQVYDKNQYDAIPSFVTSDVYLQLMHVYYGNLIKHIEETYFIPNLKTLLEALYTESEGNYKITTGNIKVAAAYNVTYYALAYYLLTGIQKAVPVEMRKFFSEEIVMLDKKSGRGSVFLQDSLFDYSQLIPRGFYTRNDNLKHYFTSMKWLLTAPQFLNNDKNISSAILTARIIANASTGDKELSYYFNSITRPVDFLVGKPDNLYMNDLIEILKRDNLLSAPLQAALAPPVLQKIRNELMVRNPEKIKAKGVYDKTRYLLSKPRMYFMPGRYTLDGEILQRLIEISTPPKRPFPKGLDIFASLGNTEAENILLNTYREQDAWSGYKDTLGTLKKQFFGFKDWDKSAYNKNMQCLQMLQNPKNNAPYYMHTLAWARKTLNTSLGYWAEMKHDVVLYAKQPEAAEAGEGGGPDPPVYPGYVEPDIDFWQNCISLLTLTDDNLKRYNMIDSNFEDATAHLKNLARFFLKVSTKEINHQNLTGSDFDSILWIGGNLEMLTQQILGPDRQLNDPANPDRYAACISDVYTYTNQCLEEGTAWGDELYAVVEINGYLYVTKGAVFSYREFTQPSSDRITDEEWHKMMEADAIPKAPVWLQRITVPVKPLETLPWYTYSANPSGLKDQ